MTKFGQKIKRALLIAPPARTFPGARDVNPLPPIGLGLLAAVLERKGVEVKILDCLARGWNTEEEAPGGLVKVGLTYPEIKREIENFAPEMVGLNCQFSRQRAIYHETLAAVKSVSEDIVTVCGGAHTTVCPDEILADTNCDFIIIGEGEDSFVKLIDAVEKNSGFEAIDGFGMRGPGGKPAVRPKTTWVKDLDSIPFPAYHLMDLELYFGLPASHGDRHRVRFCPVMTSRGCPAKCVFCSAKCVWGNNFRVRSVDNVMEEMRLLKDKYGIEEIMFEDDNVTANPKRARELFQRMINEKLNFIWDTPNGVGVWTLTEDLIDLMKESGCVKLNFPVESGSQRVLDEIIKKPLDLEKVKKLTAHCHKIGLDCGMFLVSGLPGETIADVWKSYKFAADCKCYQPHISIATPYPGTELFEKCENEGLFSRPYNLDELFIKSFLIKTPEWDEKKLRGVFSMGLFYLQLRKLIDNPGQLFRMAKAVVTNPGSLIKHMKNIVAP
jgi:magnesium-protoporphyrin IX monomethyl ester (oxidative) cyclase